MRHIKILTDEQKQAIKAKMITDQVETIESMSKDYDLQTMRHFKYTDMVIKRITARRKYIKIGRNAICPCLSGRKFKHCCKTPIKVIEQIKENKEAKND